MLDHIGRIVFSDLIRWVVTGAIDWATFMALLNFMRPPHGCWDWSRFGGILVGAGAGIGAGVASGLFGAIGATNMRTLVIGFAGSVVGALAAGSVNVMAGSRRASAQ